MDYCRVLLACFACCTFLTLDALGGAALPETEANFWLAINDNGPQVPYLEVLSGSSNTIDIWASPADDTDSGGLPLTLGGYSLNLVAETSYFSNVITFQSVDVLNCEQDGGDCFEENGDGEDDQGVRRHQLVFDSWTSWGTKADTYNYNDNHLQDDRIDNFFGATFVNDSTSLINGTGLGPTCGDDQCVMIDGRAAWKIAEVTFRAEYPEGLPQSTELYLEIGEQGIWHFGDTLPTTTARFGDPADNDPDDVHTWPIDVAPHHGLPDAVIQVVSQLPDADFDGSGLVDGPDFLIWQRGFGVGSLQSQGNANPTVDGVVDEKDLMIWQAQYGSSSLSLLAVPEANTIALFCLGCAGLLGTYRLG